MFNAVPPLTVFAEIVVSKGMIAALSMLWLTHKRRALEQMGEHAILVLGRQRSLHLDVLLRSRHTNPPEIRERDEKATHGLRRNLLWRSDNKADFKVEPL